MERGKEEVVECGVRIEVQERCGGGEGMGEGRDSGG